MTTLRDEIYNVLDESGRVKAGYYTDIILKLIEKKTDYIHEIKEEYNYEGHYHGGDEFWSGYELGFEKAFEIIKQEMLKNVTNNKR
jgi:hypothetical protein